MHVVCKKCAVKIAVAGRPSGSNSLQGVNVQGNVRVGGGAVVFGRGGSISFRSGGSVGFGGPRSSPFTCPTCGHVADYSPEEILDD